MTRRCDSCGCRLDGKEYELEVISRQHGDQPEVQSEYAAIIRRCYDCVRDDVYH